MVSFLFFTFFVVQRFVLVLHLFIFDSYDDSLFLHSPILLSLFEFPRIRFFYVHKVYNSFFCSFPVGLNLNMYLIEEVFYVFLFSL